MNNSELYLKTLYNKNSIRNIQMDINALGEDLDLKTKIQANMVVYNPNDREEAYYIDYEVANSIIFDKSEIAKIEAQLKDINKKYTQLYDTLQENENFEQQMKQSEDHQYTEVSDINKQVLNDAISNIQKSNKVLDDFTNNFNFEELISKGIIKKDGIRFKVNNQNADVRLPDDVLKNMESYIKEACCNKQNTSDLQNFNISDLYEKSDYAEVLNSLVEKYNNASIQMMDDLTTLSDFYNDYGYDITPKLQPKIEKVNLSEINRIKEAYPNEFTKELEIEIRKESPKLANNLDSQARQL